MKKKSKLNCYLGKTNVEGEGIVIVLEDNEYGQITAKQLLNLVNELKYAGAEAISINENRIVNLTDDVPGVEKIVSYNKPK